ncbi:MAG: hypothetical protein JNG88_02810 [Phycisphaerales bacterium]|nr:hypothetical protein [Phycisphaerales bacterium]
MRLVALTFSAVAFGLLTVGACQAPPESAPCKNNAVSRASAASTPQPHSLLGRPLLPDPPGDRAKLEQALHDARAQLDERPDDPDRLIWVGRRLGYLWRIQEAIDVYSDGIRRFPDYAALYRHRGHRYITLRQFDAAIRDLKKAAELLGDRPDQVEPDGMPNAKNIPLTTLKFNVSYHLALAHYFNGDFQAAFEALNETMRHTRGYDDNLVAVSDWMYLTLMRLGRAKAAADLLEPISQDMNIIENTAYHRRLLMYKGLLSPEGLLSPTRDDVAVATLGYGVAMHFEFKGESRRAREILERVVAGKSWPAFGFIAAEAELARQ